MGQVDISQTYVVALTTPEEVYLVILIYIGIKPQPLFHKESCKICFAVE